MHTVTDTAGTTRGRPLSRGERLVLVAVATSLLVFAVWPAFVPRDDSRQIEFAWEMYAKGAPPQSFEVDLGGEKVVYEPWQLVPTMVAEIPYEDLMPPWLCLRLPIRRVVVRIADRSWIHECDG